MAHKYGTGAELSFHMVIYPDFVKLITLGLCLYNRGECGDSACWAEVLPPDECNVYAGAAI